MYVKDKFTYHLMTLVCDEGSNSIGNFVGEIMDDEMKLSDEQMGGEEEVEETTPLIPTPTDDDDADEPETDSTTSTEVRKGTEEDEAEDLDGDDEDV